MKSSLLTVIVGLVTQTIAAPAPVSHIVHEKRDIDSSTWILNNIKLRRDAIIPMSIGLTQRNLEHGYDFLMDVSDRKSPNYGKHWTMEKIAETFKSSDETIAAVRAWLFENGISLDRLELSKGMNWFRFNATIEEAEALLHTEYKVFSHVETGQPHVACHEYFVPREVRDHIDFITPTVQFDAVVKVRPRKRAEGDLSGRDTTSALPVSGAKPGPEIPPSVIESARVNATALANCDQMITPACLRALYGIPQGEYQLSSYGIVEYTPNVYVPSDLDLFYSNFAAEIPAGTRPTVDLIDGAIIQTFETGFQYNGESNLDLQYAISLVNPQRVTLYQVGDISEGASFNNFLDAIDGSYCTSGGGDYPPIDGTYPDPNPGGYKGKDCGTVHPAAVISTSYGTTESYLTASYARRQCDEYMKLGLAGVTILYSSGDYGVAGLPDSNGTPLCCTNPGCAGGAQSTGGIYFNPTFPSTCPYVTSVGATQMAPGSDFRDPEIVCQTVITSSGGFSNIFPLPSYQAKAVAKYYKDHKPNLSGLYNDNQAARGYPDVAANGAYYAIALNGGIGSAFGTSASSPTFGSIIALINERRAHYGKGPVGFINPTIYEHPESFHDVLSGSNPGCGSPGFQAVPDWNPITGLGTPDYERLVDIFG